MIDIQGLDVVFGHGRKTFHAVQDLSLKVEQGQSYGLVGESGSGKSVISQAIMGVLPSSAELSGQILFNDKRLQAESGGPPQPLDIVTLDLQGPRMRARHRP